MSLTTSSQPQELAKLSQAQLGEIYSIAQKDGTLKRQPLIKAIAKSRSTIEPLALSEAGAMGPDTLDFEADPKKIYRFIVGVDQAPPKMMNDEEIETTLQDPLSNLILKRGNFPLSANGLLDAFEQTKNEENGLKERDVFLIGEGGQLPWDELTENVDRSFRFAFCLQIKSGIGPDVMVSTGTNLETNNEFLQVMSWNPQLRAYNFFQRLGPFWIWSGNSFHSIENSTRNRGPFSGHVNGGPVMKELEQPWQNWHSMNAPIALPQGHPLNENPYFQSKETGDRFELLIKTGMDQINSSRIDRAIVNGEVDSFKHFMRQILLSTNVNLISSSQVSRSVRKTDQVPLPFSFFINSEGLSRTGVEPAIRKIKVPGNIYLQSLTDFDFHLESRNVRIPGDTHFAFFVPEFSREDLDLLQKMIRAEMISKKLAASLLMVDFSNPIYSKKRAALLEYIPDLIAAKEKGKDLDEKFVAAIQASGNSEDPSKPEGEFFAIWNIEEWVDAFEGRVESYFQQIQEKCNTQEGFNDFVKLAEYRRYRFKNTPLFEFDLTFPVTNINLGEFPLEMTQDASVVHRE